MTMIKTTNMPVIGQIYKYSEELLFRIDEIYVPSEVSDELLDFKVDMTLAGIEAKKIQQYSDNWYKYSNAKEASRSEKKLFHEIMEVSKSQDDQEIKMAVTITTEKYEKLRDGITALQMLQASTNPGKIVVSETEFSMIKANAMMAARIAIDFVDQLGGAEVEILEGK